LLSLSYYLDSFNVTSEDDQFVYFSNAGFELMGDQGLVLSGIFDDIKLDKTKGDFTGSISNLDFTSLDPFLRQLYNAPSVYQFMSPMNAI
jgi:hypothetical protein